MKSLVKIENLDLVGLMKASLDREEIVTYPYSVHWGSLVGDKGIKFLNCEDNEEDMMDADFKLEDTTEVLKENENNYVFVNFSASNTGDPIDCIDGNSYGNGYFDEDEDDEEKTGEGMLDDSSSFGYVIQYKDGLYVINSGIFSVSSIMCHIPPTSSVELVEECLVFDEPLENYLDKFISK
jgi:hypothetical protein